MSLVIIQTPFFYFSSILNFYQLMKIFSEWKMVALASVSLGLAPLVPEPHICRWRCGDAAYWFDTLLHGFPWML